MGSGVIIFSGSDAQPHKSPIGALRGRSANFDTDNGDGPSVGLAVTWPSGNMQKFQQPSSYSVLSGQKQSNLANRGDISANQGSCDSRFLPEQRIDTALNNVLPNQLQFPNEHPGYFPNKLPIQTQVTTLPPQYMSSIVGHEIFRPIATIPRLSHLRALPLHHGNIQQGRNTGSAGNPVPNVMLGVYQKIAPSGQWFVRGAPPSTSAPRSGPPPLLQTSG